MLLLLMETKVLFLYSLDKYRGITDGTLWGSTKDCFCFVMIKNVQEQKNKMMKELFEANVN
jgi:hypothetical protein